MVCPMQRRIGTGVLRVKVEGVTTGIEALEEVDRRGESMEIRKQVAMSALPLECVQWHHHIYSG